MYSLVHFNHITYGVYESKHIAVKAHDNSAVVKHKGNRFAATVLASGDDPSYLMKLMSYFKERSLVVRIERMSHAVNERLMNNQPISEPMDAMGSRHLVTQHIRKKCSTDIETMTGILLGSREECGSTSQSLVFHSDSLGCDNTQAFESDTSSPPVCYYETIGNNSTAENNEELEDKTENDILEIPLDSVFGDHNTIQNNTNAEDDTESIKQVDSDVNTRENTCQTRLGRKIIPVCRKLQFDEDRQSISSTDTVQSANRSLDVDNDYTNQTDTSLCSQFESDTVSTTVFQDEFAADDSTVQSYEDLEDETDTLDIPLTMPKNASSRQSKSVPKYHCCYFCGKLYTNIRKHWKQKHSEEPLYIEALENKCGQNIKQHRAFEKLRKLGDDKFNQTADSQEKILVRNYYGKRKNEPSFVTCPNCCGWYSETNFNNHKCCQMASKKVTIGQARIKSIQFPKVVCSELKEKILAYFQKKNQREAIFNDPVILHYADFQYNVYYEGPHKGDGSFLKLSADLRLLADLVIIAKEKFKHIRTLNDLLQPSEVEKLFKIIEIRCGYDGVNYKSPGVVNAACILIKKVLVEMAAVAASQGNAEMERIYKSTEEVFKKRQNSKLTKRASRVRTARQRIKTERLPSTAQVSELLKVLDEELDLAVREFKETVDEVTYYNVMKTLLAKIIVFNRKRPGDVQRMLIEEFHSASYLDDNYLAKYQNEERKMLGNLRRIKTQHKLNQTSAVLLTVSECDIISMLLTHRTKLDISDSNQYVFALPRQKRSNYLKGGSCLRSICEKRNLDYSLLKATKLRKHLATYTSGVSQEEQSALSTFMAHSLAIHNSIYTISRTETDVGIVGRMLLSAGGIWPKQSTVVSGSYASQCLSESSQVTKASASSALSGTQLSFQRPSSSSQNVQPCPSLDQTRNQCSNPNFDVVEVDLSKAKRKSSNEYFLNTLRDVPAKSVKRRYIAQHPVSSASWRTPQKKDVRELFKHFLVERRVPSINEIQHIMTTSKIRNFPKTYSQVRAWINAEIKRNQEGSSKQRWTTPQKLKLRERFKVYYEKTLEKMMPYYPSTSELKQATQQIPELQCKSIECVKAKLQHEFRLKLNQIEDDQIQDGSGLDSYSSDSSSI